MLSRVLSGYAILTFPMAKNTGLAYTFALGAEAAAVRAVLLCEAALCALVLLVAGRLEGLAVLLAAAAAFLVYKRVSWKEFGGISGDLAGWFLQRAELWMLCALAAAQYLVPGR